MKTPCISTFLPTAPDWHLDWQGIDAAYPWIRKLRGETDNTELLSKGPFWTQDAQHHAEGSVWIHTRMVVEELVSDGEWRATSVEEQTILFAAALLHDVCKPETWAIDDGRITNRHHSRMGSNEARQILWRMGWSFGAREKVCALIAVHQVPFGLVNKPEWEMRHTLITTSLRVSNRLLAILAKADAQGRICDDKDNLLLNIELFREAAKELGCYDTPYAFFNDHARMQYLRDPKSRLPDTQLFDVTEAAFTVTLMSGLPGSGKSTWIEANTRKGGPLEGQPVISMDSLRHEMKVRPQDDQGRVRQEALARARVLLAARKPFIWDAINLDWLRRTPLASLCQDYGARVSFAYVESSFEDTLSQNRARTDQVPEKIVMGMMRKWDPPSLAECHEFMAYTNDTP